MSLLSLNQIKTLYDDLRGRIEANEEGTFPEMSVGSLISDENISNNAPYLYRPVLNGVGNRAYSKLIGATMANNQLIQNGNFESTSGWSVSGGTVSAANNILTITASGANPYVGKFINFINGHRYLAIAEAKQDQSGNMYLSAQYPYINYTKNSVGTWELLHTFISPNANGNKIILFDPHNKANGNTLYLRNFNLFDLTLMFGSTIADYAYTLEQGEAGAGVAWLKSYGFFGKYAPYDAGSLISVKPTAKVVKNADETEEKTYDLGSDELRGLFKLDNGNIYADGDIKTPDGQITRKYGIVDLGTLTYAYNSTNAFFYVNLTLIGGKLASSGRGGEYICPKYNHNDVGYSSMTNGDISNVSAGIDSSVSMIVIKDSNYTSAAAFKTAMSGVYLVYELATPTTEQGTPFVNPSIVYPNGTEEYIDTRTVPVPVGNETEYTEDLKGGLETILDTPPANGTYVLKATVSGGVATLGWVAE